MRAALSAITLAVCLLACAGQIPGPKPVGKTRSLRQLEAERKRQADGKPQTEQGAKQKAGHSGEKSVSVRGYYRSDGTYVPAHSRAAPGQGTGGRGRR